MRAAAILAGALVAIGAYLFVTSFIAASAAAIGLGSLALAVTAAIAAVAATPSRTQARA